MAVICYAASRALNALIRYPILIVALTGASISMIKTGRDAVFFTKSGLDDLPAAYFWSEVALVIAGYVHLTVMKRWGSRRTRLAVFAGAAAVFLAFAPFTSPDNRILVQILYPLVPMLFAALFASAWLLVGDVLEGAETKTIRRTYSFAGAGAMIGGIAGALFARFSSEHVGAGGLVGAGAALLAVSAVIAWHAHRLRPIVPSEQPTTDEEAEAPKQELGVWSNPYTRILLAISVLGAVSGMYIEFQFYAAAFAAGKANAAFFASYYIFLSVGSLALQIVVAPWLQTRFGIARALLVLPLGVLGGAGLVAVVSTVVTQSIYKIVEAGLKNSIHRSSWEQVFLKFDREKRAAMKVVVDGVIPRIAGVVGAAALFLVVHFSPFDAPSWPAFVLLPSAALWLLATFTLGKQEPPTDVDYQIRIPES